jgi:PAS domain S-box-containing protein
MNTPQKAAFTKRITFFLSLAIIAGGVALSVAGWWFARKQARMADTERFARMTDRPMSNLKERLLELEVVLRSERALFEANDPHHPLDRTEWDSFADGVLPLVQQYVAGLTYIERVTRGQLPAFVEQVKAAYGPDFTLQTSGDRPELYLIRYARSFNYPVGLGMDLATDQTRREALEKAMLTGQPALSKHTFLLLESTRRPASILSAPIYSKGAAPATPEERRERLEGWVSARIRLDNIVYDWSDLLGGQLDYEIYDGRDVISPETFVLASTKHLIASTLVPSVEPWLHDGCLVGFRHVDLMGHGTDGWTVCFIATPAFDAAGSYAFQYSILIGGLLVSLLSGWVFWSMGTTQSRAQKRAQEEVVRKEAQFRFIFETSPVGISWRIVRPDGSQTRQVNETHLKICGITRAQMDEPGIFARITHPEDRKKQVELENKMEAGEIDNFSLPKRYLHFDGTTVWSIFRRIRKQNPDGGFQEITLISDITEERQQTDALRAAMQAAEQANIAKSQFLATMSHEIRTPMNGVIGMTSLLLETQLDSEQHEFADTIRSSGDALLAIINDILDFSKIEAGRLDLEKADFSLRECVEGTLDIVSVNAAKKGLDLLYEIAADTPSQVRGDVTRLRQILVNLLNNAIKFTEHGEVVLSLTAASIGQAAIELHFAIRDTGIGIPAAAMGRLFRSFSQVDASTTRKYGGTGLGLVISQRLAELMGGRMWAESEEGKGSTFHFSIQAEVASHKPLASLSGVRTHLTGKRLLIVDDNSTNRRILTSHAQSWGLVPRTAESGPAALQLIDSGEVFDVGIIDMQMPGMDGVMFGREVLKRGRSEKLPMILLSSVGVHHDIPEGIFVTCLTKTTKAAQILDAIVGLFPWKEGNEKVVPALASAVAPPPAGPAHSERILIAEDNVVNQRVALQMLSRLGYRADVAANGLEALSAVHRQHYDLVLMDVQMPEMDGLEATKRMMKEFPERKDRPWIIALTANAMQGDRELCLHSGMDDYISKPLRLPELSSALERARFAVVS